MIALAQFNVECIDDVSDHIVLHRKDIIEFTIVTLAPNRFFGSGDHELRRYAYPTRGLADAPFQYITDANFLSDIVGFYLPVFIVERGLPRDYMQP